MLKPFAIHHNDYTKHRYERDLQKEAVAFLRTLPFSRWSKIQQGAYSEAGISDIIGSWFGLFFCFECKSIHYTPTKIQLAYIRDIKNTGGYGGPVWSVADIKGVLNEAVRSHGVKVMASAFRGSDCCRGMATA